MGYDALRGGERSGDGPYSMFPEILIYRLMSGSEAMPSISLSQWLRAMTRSPEWKAVSDGRMSKQMLCEQTKNKRNKLHDAASQFFSKKKAARYTSWMVLDILLF